MTGHRASIFREIHDERERQDAKWGEQNHLMANPDSLWLRKHECSEARQSCDNRAARGELTWYDILKEEFCEAFAEDIPKRQREELVQVAAVAISIIECIDRKAGRA